MRSSEFSLSPLAAGLEAPEAAALVVDGQAWTWAEVAGRVAALLPLLPPGEGPVAVVGEARARVLLGLLALFEAGRTAMILHPRLTAGERAAQLGALGLGAPWSPPLPSPVPPPPPTAYPPERELCWIATSGSSGAPRVVALSRRAMLASARAHLENLPFVAGDRWQLCMPLGHVGGLSILTRCLVGRSALALDEPPEGAGHQPFSPAGLRASLARSGASLLSVVPTMLQRMIAEDPSPPPLRAILLGGAPAPANLLLDAARHGWPVLGTYGLTETGSQVCTWRPGTLPSPEEGAGPPLPGVALRIVDGEVRVRGDMLLSRLLPEGAHPSPLDPEGWLRTGDLGGLDARGRLHLRGRSSNLIITGGENVSPEEVEATLLEIPGVAGAVVFGVPDALWGQTVAAALVLEGSSLEAVIAAASERLAAHRRPRRWVSLDALPLGPNGKVDRRAVVGLLSPG